jgi:hypothetical protein
MSPLNGDIREEFFPQIQDKNGKCSPATITKSQSRIRKSSHWEDKSGGWNTNQSGGCKVDEPSGGCECDQPTEFKINV